MASKTAETAETESSAESTDSPLLDMSDAAVKKMIKAAKARGWVTYDELNKVLPSEEFSSEQIEDTMAMLSEMGITVVENDETEDQPDDGAGAADDDDEEEEGGVPAKATSTSVAKSDAPTTTLERTDDPVRMYLREMGSVELLSREGEIAIAKRIEAGRDTMILGLCESPITFHAIIQWSEALNNEEMQLREILDLDAMLSKEPPVEKMEEGEDDDDGEISEETAGPSYKEDEDEPEEEGDDEEGENGEGGSRRREEEDEEEVVEQLAAQPSQAKAAAMAERFVERIVEKAVRAGATTLVCISLPTTMAVERAKAAGLSLWCLARDDSVLRVN